MNYKFGYGAGQLESYSGFGDEFGSFESGLDESLGLFELGLSQELAGVSLSNAVTANRSLARELGWGCVTGGQVRAITEVRTLLGLGASPSEEDLAQAIARWQQIEMGRGVDGKLGPRTWGQMLRRGVIPAPGFKPASWPVFFGGRKLGVLEKTSPYLSTNDGARGGAEIELGFRVTDADAVRRAGFIEASGEDRFRWIQVVEFITVPSAASPTGFIRRASRVIDPTTLVGDIVDPHPYYWDEVTPAGASPDVHISRFLDRPARNRLCYDLIFFDRPSAPLSFAQPGRRAYFNFEVALVGVQAGPPIRNVVLNTVLWGFDLVAGGGGANVRLNSLRAGRRDGSPAFKRVVSQATNAGAFPGHCFVGADFSRPARCA